MLASVQKVIDVQNIENADNLELVKVLGWRVVHKKGEFKPGDLCIYIEIDTIVPELPEFEFLRNKNFRIKTIKLRGELSQGILFPTAILNDKINYNIYEGLDVTDVLNIKKYEKPLPQQLGGICRTTFPSKYLSMTDEIKIQSIPFLIEEIKGMNVYSSIKMDGSSATYLNKDTDVHICSRRLSLEDNEENSENTFVRMFRKYNLREKLLSLGNFAIQGEVCGPGIQKNRIGLKEHDFFVFDIFDIDNQVYLGLEDMLKFSNDLGLKTVPILDVFDFNHTLDELLEMAKGNYDGTNNRREGIVIRSVRYTTLRSLFGETIHSRVSFKVLNNDYLLKDE